MRLEVMTGVAIACFATMTAVASASEQPAPAERLIELKPGMQWEYTVSGSMKAPNAPAAMPLSGHITITIAEREFKGGKQLALEFEQKMAPAGPPPAGAPTGPPPGGAPDSIFGETPAKGVFYFRQDAKTGDVYFIGDNHGPKGAIRAARGNGGLFIPGQWSVKTSYNNKIEWDDGGHTNNFLAVNGVEVVQTGLGPLAAWRAPNGSDAADGVVISGVDWWTPELGQPAQFEAITKLPNGAEINVRAVLESTNVRR